jgi:hypothetical protein
LDTCAVESNQTNSEPKLVATKNRKPKAVDELRPEYDIPSLKGGVRGKHLAAATAGTTMVLLEPGVAEAFSDGASVNRGMRAYLRSRGRAVKAAAKPARAARA